MSSQESPRCPVWNPSTCTGTAACPPRCPRFVDKYGEPILVRPAEAGDSERLFTFYAEYPDAHRSMLLPPRDRAALDEWLDRLLDRGRSLLAVHGDRLVGHALYSPRDAEQSELLVFVDPEYHGRGIGTELCQQVIAYAAEDGHEAITLRVGRENRVAMRVYRRLGFRDIEEHPDNVEMRLDIDQSLTERVQAPPAERM
jgi:RimJ/RimL family protein N-acetyltransferase